MSNKVVCKTPTCSNCNKEVIPLGGKLALCTECNMIMLTPLKLKDIKSPLTETLEKRIISVGPDAPRIREELEEWIDSLKERFPENVFRRELVGEFNVEAGLNYLKGKRLVDEWKGEE